VPGDHGSTFGGNPLATTAGAHVMHRLLEGGVLENAKARGEQLGRRLAGLEDRHVLASGERGIGLLRGLELSQEISVDVANAAREAGLLVNPIRPDVVRFMPPLTVTEAEIDDAVDIVKGVLDSLEQS